MPLNDSKEFGPLLIYFFFKQRVPCNVHPPPWELDFKMCYHEIYICNYFRPYYMVVGSETHHTNKLCQISQHLWTSRMKSKIRPCGSLLNHSSPRIEGVGIYIVHVISNGHHTACIELSQMHKWNFCIAYRSVLYKKHSTPILYMSKELGLRFTPFDSINVFWALNLEVEIDKGIFCA